MFTFGPNVTIPSTIELTHESRLKAAVDDVSKSCLWDGPDAPDDAALHEVAGDLARAHGLSIDRAWMLVSRFGDHRHGVETVAPISRIGTP